MPVTQLDQVTVHCAMSMEASVLAVCILEDYSVDIAYQGISISHQLDVKVI